MAQCAHCPHDFDPHLVLATRSDPKQGGIILCHVKGCLCFSTWSVPQLGSTSDTITVPGMAEIEQMRAELQTE